jgi:hypothetical protein
MTKIVGLEYVPHDIQEWIESNGVTATTVLLCNGLYRTITSIDEVLVEGTHFNPRVVSGTLILAPAGPYETYVSVFYRAVRLGMFKVHNPNDTTINPTLSKAIAVVLNWD